MAQKVQTIFIDDLDGSQADGTVHFGLDGTEYEIDLNTEHARSCGTHLRVMSVPVAGSAVVPGGHPHADARPNRTG